LRPKPSLQKQTSLFLRLVTGVLDKGNKLYSKAASPVSQGHD
jgi:hypothetical protein